MTQYDVTISSKGQLVLPKEVRDKFRLSAGSRLKILIDGEQIILRPRSIGDELQDLVLTDLARDGKPVTEENIREYQSKLNKALDTIVAEADQEYKAKEYISLSELKKEDNV